MAGMGLNEDGTFPADDHDLAMLRSRARELDPEPGHAFQVCRIAGQLFEATRDVHGLGERERRLLVAGALLHDIGYRISATDHHKHARDLILQEPLPGFPENERMVVACLARYHRKGCPKPAHKVYRDLAPADRAMVDRLAALLRIADGLDRAHDAAVRALRFERRGNRAAVVLDMRRPSPIDVEGGLRKADLFTTVYGLPVEILAGQEEAPDA